MRQVRNVEDIQEFFNLAAMDSSEGQRPLLAQAEADIFKDRQMREKSVILEKIADITVPGTHIYAGFRIEEHPVSEYDSA